jgi:RimJ/RimL family protein N-acetyltransferase
VVEGGDCGAVITTDRLVVRPWRLDEADRFFDIYRRPEIVRWIGAEPMEELREAIEMIERRHTRIRVDPRFGVWAVVDRSNGVPVRGVILKPLPDGEGEVEIGWQLHLDSWGKGFASEATGAVLQRGFAQGLPEVLAVMYLDNHRPAAVCRRIGMRLLGITCRWYHEPRLLFWTGFRPGQEPSLRPAQPPPISSRPDVWDWPRAATRCLNPERLTKV